MIDGAHRFAKAAMDHHHVEAVFVEHGVQLTLKRARRVAYVDDFFTRHRVYSVWLGAERLYGGQNFGSASYALSKYARHRG